MKRTAAAFGGLALVGAAAPFDGVLATVLVAIGVGLVLWSVKGEDGDDDGYDTMAAAEAQGHGVRRVRHGGRPGSAPRSLP